MREQYDYLVIGSGIAGLTFALTVADTGSVALVTKRELAEAATSYAQGGIAAVVGEADSLASHTEDTIRAGAGLCDEGVVREVVGEGPAQVRRLLEAPDRLPALPTEPAGLSADDTGGDDEPDEQRHDQGDDDHGPSLESRRPGGEPPGRRHSVGQPDKGLPADYRPMRWASSSRW